MPFAKLRTVILLIFLCPLNIFGQVFKAGFRVIKTYDSSRLYKPNTPLRDSLHFRPIDIDLWYPTTNTNTRTASFVDLVSLLEQRSNFYDDTRNYRGLTNELLQYMCANTNCTDVNSIKTLTSSSYLNAKAVEKQFPMILYLSGFNGMSYENYLMFEELAKHGFVVACVSSIGRYPGHMTMHIEDLNEQIADAKFITNHLADESFVDKKRIGLIGYSWGGLAASILAMSEPDRIRAIVSLDGSEQFTYMDQEESAKLTCIRESDIFRPQDIHASFLYLDSDTIALENLPDSVYNINEFISGDQHYLKIIHSIHEDFSSLSQFYKDELRTTRSDIIRQLTTNFLREKLNGEIVSKDSSLDGRVTKQFFQPSTQQSISNSNRMLKGIITDRITNQPLAYVNLGIINKDRGTTTNTKGEFELPISESNVNDTIRLSMVGYESRLMYVKSLLNDHALEFQLKQKTHELKEIVIEGKKLKTRVLGNETDSKFFGAKFAPGDLGSEIAVKINIRKRTTYLENFSFNISYNSEDNATFRVNIYNVKNGLPGENLLSENIIIEVDNRTGKIVVDLSKYDLIVNDDVFVSLQWVEGKYNSGVVFSASLAKKGTYYRKASDARWKKYQMGIGFKVTAKF